MSHSPYRSAQAYNSHMSMPVGERRIVWVLIADIVGSTSLAETLGADRSKFLFDDVERLMGEAVERFGGTVAQLTGDGVLALFGAPVAHEEQRSPGRAGCARHPRGDGGVRDEASRPRMAWNSAPGSLSIRGRW